MSHKRLGKMFSWNPLSLFSSQTTADSTDSAKNEVIANKVTSLDRFDVAYLAILLRDDLIGYPFRNSCGNPLVEHNAPEKPLTMDRIGFVQDSAHVGMLLDDKPIGWHAEHIDCIDAVNFASSPDEPGFESLEQINSGWFYVHYDADGVAQEPYYHYPESDMQVAYFPSRNTWIAAALTDDNCYQVFFVTVTGTSNHRGDHVSFSISKNVLHVYERLGGEPRSCVQYCNNDAVEVAAFQKSAKGLFTMIGDEAPNLRELFGEMIDEAGFHCWQE